MNDLVSIITPTFNSANFIKETIQSVQKQTHQNWEMLITDDCSTDQTVSVVEEIKKRDSRVKLFKLNKNSGSAVARNNSIKEAKGRFHAFLDSDDIWFDYHLKDSIQAIEENQCPFVFASYKRSNENLEFVFSDFIVPEKVIYTDILKTNSISCLTAFVDVEGLGKEQMPLVRKRQDMGLWLKYLKKSDYAIGIQNVHAIYRIRENSLSRDKKKLIKSQWLFYREVEGLGRISSLYYMLCWMYLGYKKYKS